jgi:F0F1-type ATP synthase membrane subunit b/b'
MADLRGEVAQLAIGAAEVVVGRSLDEATQVQLVEDYINQVAAQRA